MTQIAVKDANGVTQNVEAPLAPGRAAAASSRPVALSTEDLAALNGLSGKLPAALGQTTKANSLSVTFSSDDDIQGKLGALTETAPANDTASSGLNGRLQRIAQRLSSLIAQVPATLGQTNMAGSLSVTVASNQSSIPVSDAAGSLTVDAPVATPLFVRLSDGAAAVTPLVGAQLPASLGVKTAANSLSITHASDDAIIALTGAVTETAPASDTASSGLNGRLQRIAQRLTSMIAQLPASLGIKTAANSLSITHASDDAIVTATGAPADAAWASGSGSMVALLKTIATGVLDTATASLVKIDQTTDGTTNRVNAVPGSTAHALIPAPSTYRLLSAAATTNGANIKASAGTVKGIQGFNNKASAVFLKLYNKASAPTVGTDTPVKTIYLPASAAFAFDFGTGVAFATGISIALTGAGADADTTALAAGDIVALNVDYH